MAHSSAFRTCLFCNIDIITYYGSAPAKASWRMDTCPSTAARALPSWVQWLRMVLTERRQESAMLFDPRNVDSISAPGSITRSWLTGLQDSVRTQCMGRWQPSHTARAEGQTAAYSGALGHWTYTKSWGEDNIRQRIHTPAIPKKEMTKMTAAHAFPLWEVTLPEDIGHGKLSVGIYRGILTSFLGVTVLFLQKFSEMIACMTISTSQRWWCTKSNYLLA